MTSMPARKTGSLFFSMIGKARLEEHAITGPLAASKSKDRPLEDSEK